MQYIVMFSIEEETQARHKMGSFDLGTVNNCLATLEITKQCPSNTLALCL